MNRYILLLGAFLQATAFAEDVPLANQMQRAVLGWPEVGKIEALVRAGVDPNAPIGCGTFSPLDGAISQQNPEMVDLLISLGAKPKEGQMVAAAFCSSHDAALRIVTSLHAAGLSFNARAYSSGDKKRFTMPIHNAVWRENKELIAYLIKQKGIQLDEVNIDGYTPLMIAVEHNRGDIVDMLLAAGADPLKKNKKGVTAADVADQMIEEQARIKAKLVAEVKLAKP